ncbi:FCD domain-containing protein [Streptomyces sp. SID8361]|uniref:GntR family transcriptional regulator n=1 Tax=Streptomyces sp. MnatMP-M27 TaxID=1839768 RepID=UPI00081E75C8|nr:GntR family transcriptional regulator [Streptomyces sp. MnatMP-M27]MYU15745.1 FCD domain-containing protein [Streptomyces sp. SID8361]SCG10214.1 transcriptional regulator, GntR family [Streptomyces sp. MnatMP-M27]
MSPGVAAVRERVTAELRAALISGDLKAGEVYSAPSLAGRLGVSATPVREAMQDLAREGMVEVVRNTGFRVTELSDRELDELAEIRTFIEVPAMGLVAENCVGDVAERVEELRETARELVRAANTASMVEFMRLDTEFHTAFLALHGNRRLVEEVTQLRYRSRLYRLEALARAGTLEQTTREHEQMVDLALARDRMGMERLMRAHIGHTRGEWAQR